MARSVADPIFLLISPVRPVKGKAGMSVSLQGVL
jgi:hypothetical protein